MTKAATKNFSTLFLSYTPFQEVSFKFSGIMRYLVWMFFPIFLLSRTGKAQLATNEKAKTRLISSIDSILNGAVVHEEIPGAVIEVKQNGKVIYKQAYGYSQKYN